MPFESALEAVTDTATDVSAPPRATNVILSQDAGDCGVAHQEVPLNGYARLPLSANGVLKINVSGRTNIWLKRATAGTSQVSIIWEYGLLS